MVFQFNNGLAKDRVLQKHPWSFSRSLLVLQEFDGYVKPEDVNMDWCTFRVQIHGLPLGLMNERIWTVLSEAIGEWKKWRLMKTSQFGKDVSKSELPLT